MNTATPLNATEAIATRTPFFRLGWINVWAAALAMVATLPGRTVGLGLVTEPILRDLNLSRTTYGAINLWATLLGAGFGLFAGRLLDRFGARAIIATLTLLLGLVVVGIAKASGTVGLFVAVTLTRGLGQSALSAASIALVGKWFEKRVGPAMAVYSVALSIGFMIAIPSLEAVAQQAGWRAAWGGMGWILAIVIAPLFWLIVRSSPESTGVRADGRAVSETTDEARVDGVSGHTLRQALSTPAFWALALGGFAFNAAYSGVTLFNESILAERGFTGSPTGPLVVIVFAALASNGLTGWLLAKGIRVTRLMGVATLLLAASLLVLPNVRTTTHVMLYAGAMGVSAGAVTVCFFAAWSRLFGRLHLGRIQGAAQAITVLASAIGPLILAQSSAQTGSYTPAFYGCAAIALILGAFSMRVREPHPRTST